MVLAKQAVGQFERLRPCRPLGNASTMWTAATRYSGATYVPSVKIVLLFDSARPARNQKNPTTTIRNPNRFSGRRDHAYTPTPTNDSPMTAPRIATAALCCSWLLVSVIATSKAAKTTPTAKRA